MIDKITVITVCYNAEATIEQTIKSVIEQTYSNIEYVVIDGKSKDNTVNIIKKYSNSIDYWVSEADGGIYDAMNKGINKSTGEWIIFLNADDYLKSDSVVSEVAEYLKDEFDIVYGDIVAFSRIHKKKYRLYSKPVIEVKNFVGGMPLAHPATFIKRNLFINHGLFATKYKGAGDYEWFLRVFTEGVKSKYISKVVTYFSLGGISSEISTVNYQDKFFINKKYLGKHFFIYLALFPINYIKSLLLTRFKKSRIVTLYKNVKYKKAKYL